jgi:hypothetical protein
VEWWTIAVIVLVVAARPVEVHFWRNGRLSDRAMTLLLVGRFPVVIGLLALLSSAPLPLTASVLAISLLPSLVFYPLVREFVSDRSPGAQRGGTPAR